METYFINPKILKIVEKKESRIIYKKVFLKNNSKILKLRSINLKIYKEK